MTVERVERRLAAILAADVVGYSRLVSADEATALSRLGTLRRDIIEPSIAAHSGRLFKIMGDGFLAEFASAVQAISCALVIQTEAEAAASVLDDSQKMRLRIGIHVGDVIVDGEDLMGDGINIAARLESIAEAGGISISRAVHDQVRDRIKVTFDDHGEVALKNIARSVQVFTVAGANSAVSVKTRPSAFALPDKPSIAVLPFQNMSGDPEQDYFADGMVEDIITGLSRSKALFVIARNSSFTYKGKAVDIKSVGRELGVRYVLEGSVRKAGTRVRITGQLIDATTGAHIWADRFDAELDDIFDLQDRVTASVIGAISPQLMLAEFVRVQSKPTENLVAYDYYLRALSCLYTFNREANESGCKLVEQAIALDPRLALAYALGANLRTQSKAYEWVREGESNTRVTISLVRRALELDQNDPTVLTHAGWGIAYVGGELEEGASLLSRAIEIDPNMVAARLWFGWTIVYLDKLDAAIESFQAVLRLSPLEPRLFLAHQGIAFAEFLAGRYDRSLVQATIGFRLRPNFAGIHRVLIASYAMLGRHEEARQACARLLQLDPGQRISKIREILPFRRPEEFEKLAVAYRIAGIPE